MKDDEWALTALFMPAPRLPGRPRKVDLREVVKAIPHLASTGCQLRMLPKDFPPVSTVQRDFYHWLDGGLFRQGKGLRASALQMDSGADLRLALPMPPAGQGLGEIHRFREAPISADSFEAQP